MLKILVIDNSSHVIGPEIEIQKGKYFNITVLQSISKIKFLYVRFNIFFSIWLSNLCVFEAQRNGDTVCLDVSFKTLYRVQNCGSKNFFGV